jgi:hypothetical protein
VVGRPKLLAVGFVVAAHALVAGCGGDSETATVTGQASTTTVTETVTAALQPEAKGRDSSNRAPGRQTSEQAKPDRVGLQDAPQESADGRDTRFQQRPQQQSPQALLTTCLREEGVNRGELRPGSEEAMQARARVRACILRKLEG